MEENSPRVSRKGDSGGGGGAAAARKSRYAVDEGGDSSVECSGKYCRSCTAGVIADCVALCCCPCAVLNLLTLTFVKVPWKMGRRCLGLGKKKARKLEMKRKCKKNCCCCDHSNSKLGNTGCDRNLREIARVEEEIWDFSIELRDDGEQERENFSARFEAEKVWLELYEVGHLGFGRVSFTST